MTNNEILRRVKVTFSYNVQTLITFFESVEYQVTPDQVKGWLNKSEDTEVEMKDVELAAFLNGFINHKRGKKEGEQPVPEEELNNNLIFRKLRIALNLKDTDILGLLKLAGLNFGKSELSAFFRKPTHKHYRYCKDQVLRNFMNGVYLKEKEGKK